MSMTRDPAPENPPSGRGLRAILVSVASTASRFLSQAGSESAERHGSGHLGRQRALRLSAMLAPRNRLRVGALAGAVLAAGLIIGALTNRDAEQLPLNNAIWLDRAWVYGDPDDARLDAFISQLTDHRIGKAYTYVSSLGIDGRWSGGAQGATGFMNSRATVSAFVESFKHSNDQMQLLAWIEIWANLDQCAWLSIG